MTTSTPNLALVLYNSTTDSAEYFSNFRATIAGTSLTSNFYKIDTAYGNMQTEIDDIQAGAYFTLASYISANYYEATVAGITAYNTGMKIILQLDTASAGTVTLNINSLGIKSVMKIDATGTPVNISAGELMVGKYYFFAYDGTRWVWVEANSGDQIYIQGTAGNNVRISSRNTLEDAGVLTTLTQNIQFSGDITPSQITSNQNNYSPTGLSTASTIRLNSNAIREITGLAGGADGRVILIHNIGSFGITLKNSSISSSAANRFLFSEDLTLKSNMSILLQYDSASTKWRVLGGGGGAWGDITGTLSDQTDLNNELNARLTKDADNQIAIGTQYTVADDAATSFTPMTTAGLILIQLRSASAEVTVTNYLFSFYVTSAGGSFSPTYAIGSNTVVTTGALTGTTGTDGKLTLSVNTSNGKIYIENRTGASRNIVVKIW